MGGGGFRVMGISLMSGIFSPPTMRSRACHVMRSLDTRVMTLVPEAIFPSRVTPVLFTIQRLPSRVQIPSPKPPSESKTQERIFLARGSQPIRCEPVIIGRPPIWTLNSLKI